MQGGGERRSCGVSRRVSLDLARAQVWGGRLGRATTRWPSVAGTSLTGTHKFHNRARETRIFGARVKVIFSYATFSDVQQDIATPSTRRPRTAIRNDERRRTHVPSHDIHLQPGLDGLKVLDPLHSCITPGERLIVEMLFPGCTKCVKKRDYGAGFPFIVVPVKNCTASLWLAGNPPWHPILIVGRLLFFFIYRQRHPRLSSVLHRSSSSDV